MSKSEPTQLECANELLRAAHDIISQVVRGKVWHSCETRANGGGDSHCVLQELADYFDTYDVERAPMWPDESE